MSVLPYPSLASFPLVDALRLIRSENVGPLTFFQLLAHHGSPEAALAALPCLARNGGKRIYTPCSIEAAEHEIEAAQRFGAHFIVYGSVEYPALLQGIADPPPVLTVLGDASLWQHATAVAVVGSRNASANGARFAARLSQELGAMGFLVVSGLARGIDAAAHRGALATGSTAGVIAGGTGNIYPPENQELYGELQARGAILSEQPFGSLPFAGSFPGRNRIIAGMSTGVVVVEASPKSGSLITARMAAEQGREVMAVPGSPLDPRAKGCNQLLRDGAALIESAEDVACALRAPRALLTERPAPVFTPAEASEPNLSEARGRLMERLGPIAVGVDELLLQCEIPPALAQAVLLELELAGKLQRLPGGRVCLLMTEAMAD